MKMNDKDEVIDPVLHDAELVRFDFDDRSITLHIKLSHSDKPFVLQLIGPRWLSFSTNCPQNVIDKIYITHDLRRAAAAAPADIRDMLWTRDQMPGATPLKAIFITPIAGPELIGIVADVQAL